MMKPCFLKLWPAFRGGIFQAGESPKLAFCQNISWPVRWGVDWCIDGWGNNNKVITAALYSVQWWCFTLHLHRHWIKPMNDLWLLHVATSTSFHVIRVLLWAKWKNKKRIYFNCPTVVVFGMWSSPLPPWLTRSCGLLQLLVLPIRHFCIPLPLSSVHLLFPSLPPSHFTLQSNPGCFHANIPQHPIFPDGQKSLIIQLLNTSAPIRQMDAHFQPLKPQTYRIRRQHSTCPTFMSLKLQQKEGAPFYGLPGGP